MRELAKFSANAENQKQFAAADGFLLALKKLMLCSQNCDVHRCVATVVANMAQTCPSKLVETGVGQALCTFLSDLTRGVDQRQCQRESVRALTTLIKASQSRADDGVVQQQPIKHKEPGLVESANRVLSDMLGACTDSRLQAMCRKALARSG